MYCLNVYHIHSLFYKVKISLDLFFIFLLCLVLARYLTSPELLWRNLAFEWERKERISRFRLLDFYVITSRMGLEKF